MTETNATPPDASISEPKTLTDRVREEVMEWVRLLSVFIPAFFFFSMVLFEQRVIPSESMVPALQVGDRVAVNKFAYGYSRFSIPWGVDRLLPLGSGRLFGRQPKHGDVVVFMHPHYRRVMIKRLIGMPGDRVELRNEQLFLNGRAVPTEFIRDFRYNPRGERGTTPTREYREELNGASYLAHQWYDREPLDSTPVFIVPDGHFFFIGDNRDNSKDARDLSGHCPTIDGVVEEAGCDPRLGVSAKDASVGFVPFDHLIGRAETVLWTTKRCATQPRLECAEPRVWKSL
ncbi:MAG: signal peptidase I [Pseudomonadota bacterium]